MLCSCPIRRGHGREPLRIVKSGNALSPQVGMRMALPSAPACLYKRVQTNIYRPQLMGGQVQRAKPYTYQPFCKAGPLHAGLLQALHMRAHLKWCQSEHHRHMHLSPRFAGPRSFHQRRSPRLHHTASGCMAPRRVAQQPCRCSARLKWVRPKHICHDGFKAMKQPGTQVMVVKC